MFRGCGRMRKTIRRPKEALRALTEDAFAKSSVTRRWIEPQRDAKHGGSMENDHMSS
jgi:hypothetical protein